MTGAMTLSPRRGIALILAAGVLVLLALVGNLLLGIARLDGLAAARWSAALRARLAAESGMDYAAARLSRQTGFPRPSSRWTLATRGDDWNPRIPFPVPEGSEDPWRYPSFRHGEAWNETVPLKGDGLDNDRDGAVDEADEGAGLASPGEGPAADLDGDGRLSAWTGRTRGAAGGLSGRFAVRVECPEGKLPVNAGWLDARAGDLSHPFHKGVEHALNNLGAVLGVSTTRTVKTGIPLGSGEPVVLSSLGTDLVSARAAGGYAGPEAVRRAFLSLGYPPSDAARVLPFLDPGPYAPLCEAGRQAPGDGIRFPESPLVNLAVAPPEVIESLLRYLAAAVPLGASGKPLLPGDPPAGLLSSRAGGLPYWDAAGPRCLPLVLWPDEAAALAGFALKRRQGGSTSFIPFWEGMTKDLAGLFPVDAADLGALFDGWGAAKAQLAFTALSPDPYPAPIHGHALWCSSGILGTDGEHMLSILDLSGVRRILYPGAGGAWAPDDWAPHRRPGDAILPIWGTLAPPGLFDVTAVGRCDAARSGSVSGRFRALERVVFTSQEDFENLTGAPSLARRGIRADDPDPAARFEVRPGPHGPSPGIVSFPRRNRRSLTAAPESPPYDGFSRAAGMLALSHACNAQGAALYLPFTDDWDPAGDAEFMSRGTAVLRYPVSPALHPPDDPAFTPCAVERDPDPARRFLFDCPGLSAGVPYLDGKDYSFTVSCWAHPGGRLSLWGDGRRLLHLTLDRVQHDEATVTLAVDWTESSGLPFKEQASWSVPYSPGPEFVSTWSPSLAVTLRATDEGDRFFQVYANGLEYDVRKQAMRLKLPPGSKLDVSFQETLDLSGVSNVRFYDRATEPIDARRASAIFSGWGVFRSPRYVCLGPRARLQAASCTVPLSPLPAFGCAVDLHAYDDAGIELAGSPVLVGHASPSDLSRLGPARSFDYEVRLQGDGFRSPVFESIWILLQRAGRAPAWVLRD